MTSLRSITLLPLALAVSTSPLLANERPMSRGSLEQPNVVLIFMDDLGYGDVRPFGRPRYATPNLDRLASEGRSFTDFAVSSAVCSASRAALLTGCYHMRVGISGALGPNSKIGLAPSETTLAEICKSRGYATACVGKWHLGNDPQFMPLQQGFDRYYGLPYSNDMWPRHPSVAQLPPDAAARKSGYPPLPLYQDAAVIDAEITAEDQTRLTTDYTERAIEFIRDHRDEPFFLYLAHAMVHVPLFVRPENDGHTGMGLFADVMSEVDGSVGQILSALDEAGVAENTLVIFTSDNGPWLSYGAHAGSAGILREGKGTSFEGGVRVPMIARWPGKIPPGTRCDEFAATIDVLPTVAKIIQAELPSETIDGKDIASLLFPEQPAESPHESYYIYFDQQLQAVRDRRWKLMLPHKYRSLEGRAGGADGSPAAYSQIDLEMSLFDLKSDPAESRNVIGSHRDVAERLQLVAARARELFGDRPTGQPGSAIRGPKSID
jgi:arylsulfatase A-like enzyme